MGAPRRRADDRSRRAARARRSDGAGKSTLAKLVARFYDPQRGSITFGGVDLRDATGRSLRERIVVVPQEGFLFNGTIRDNVRIARADATDAEVDAALGCRRCGRAVRLAARGLRDRGARARQPALRGRTPARVTRAGRACRSRGARPRRGHLEPRPRHRSDGRAGDGPADRRSHRDRDRPPPVDRRARRSRRRRRPPRPGRARVRTTS